MYLISCSATAKKALEEVEEGEVMPFIVYINFADIFGAEYLCKLYLMRAGFGDVVLEKRKQLTEEQVQNMQENDSDIQEAIKSGYCIRMFDSH